MSPECCVFQASGDAFTRWSLQLRLGPCRIPLLRYPDHIAVGGHRMQSFRSLQEDGGFDLDLLPLPRGISLKGVCWFSTGAHACSMRSRVPASQGHSAGTAGHLLEGTPAEVVGETTDMVHMTMARRHQGAARATLGHIPISKLISSSGIWTTVCSPPTLILDTPGGQYRKPTRPPWGGRRGKHVEISR